MSTVKIEFAEGEARAVERLLKEVIDKEMAYGTLGDVFESARVRFTMALNELTPKCSRLQSFRRNKRYMNPITSKRVLEEYMHEDGYRLDTRKAPGVGAPLQYFAQGGPENNRFLLDNAYPGDTRNWEAMYETFLEELDRS